MGQFDVQRNRTAGQISDRKTGLYEYGQRKVVDFLFVFYDIDIMIIFLYIKKNVPTKKTFTIISHPLIFMESELNLIKLGMDRSDT